MTLRCLIIDDEPSSQLVLKTFIADVGFLELCGIANNAVEAMNLLQDHTDIDLLFLDINMPKISGLTFYKSLQNPPHVIFTTAYSQYAIEGFEVNAIDYLLKPFSFDRFFKAVNKVIENQSGKELKNHEDSFILIKSSKTLHKVNPNDILFIEALGDYVKVHLETSYILTNNTFSSVLESLPELMFIRTHKSFAINFAKMNSVEGNLITINHHKIPIGQKYKAAFLSMINTGKKL
ncbi:LytTR family DNA-binding domain-containing protein [Gaetbulibacter aquiaggeris]|uniref:LytTR family DNA-binding domain-containing protein n=1 Tax=Gaetbulibacter aquiaggeris TaxID=1735373 RepID=A0ABW7MWC6_9FLAO